jgi:hypothetical protein
MEQWPAETGKWGERQIGRTVPAQRPVPGAQCRVVLNAPRSPGAQGPRGRGAQESRRPRSQCVVTTRTYLPLFFAESVAHYHHHNHHNHRNLDHIHRRHISRPRFKPKPTRHSSNPLRLPLAIFQIIRLASNRYCDLVFFVPAFRSFVLEPVRLRQCLPPPPLLVSHIMNNCS